MSWNNVIPSWVISGEKAIKDFFEGNLSYEEAKQRLEDLGCPPSMIGRLDNDNSNDE